MAQRRRLAGALATLAAGLWLLPAAAAGQEVGFVAAATGSVEIQAGGAASFAAAAVDGPVRVGDTIRTGPGASAKLVLADDSVLTLDESTTLTLDALVLGAAATRDPSVVRMLHGRVRASIGDAFGGTSSLELHTPSAVIGVKGTRYEAFHSRAPQPYTRVCNLEGSIWVRPADPRYRQVAWPPEATCTFVYAEAEPRTPLSFEQAGEPPVDEDFPPLREPERRPDDDFVVTWRDGDDPGGSDDPDWDGRDGPPRRTGPDDDPYDDALESLMLSGATLIPIVTEETVDPAPERGDDDGHGSRGGGGGSIVEN